MDNLQNDIMAFAISTAPKGASEMKSSKPQKIERVSWTEGEETRLKAKVNKEVKDWNQRDFLHYISHIYFEATGANFIYSFAANYRDLADMQHRIEQNMKENCSRETLRDYIKNTFQKFIIPLIGRGKRFSTYMFCTDQFVMDFCNKLREKRIVVSVEEEISDGKLTEKDCADAMAINPKYFVTNYGPVIQINYLLLIKKMTLQDAKSVTLMAIQKAGRECKDEIVQQTNKFKYPKWLPFLDVQSLKLEWLKEIQVCDDNQVFEFLKAYIEKAK